MEELGLANLRSKKCSIAAKSTCHSAIESMICNVWLYFVRGREPEDVEKGELKSKGELYLLRYLSSPGLFHFATPRCSRGPASTVLPRALSTALPLWSPELLSSRSSSAFFNDCMISISTCRNAVRWWVWCRLVNSCGRFLDGLVSSQFLKESSP
jgi:hypothetical protein